MARPTDAELALLRTQPHRTRFFLSIYKPDTILSCQVNEPGISKGERIISYNNVTEGSHTNVERGMTMRVGSTAGDDDLGTIYVKSATANTITVGENSHINWSNNLYLTIIDFFQIWPLYPRYEEFNGNVKIYKDYDVAYTNQNTILGSLICMGPHHAGFLEDGECNVYYSASGTVHVGGKALTYAWEFEGAPSGTSNVHTPGYVTYDTPGHYTTKLTASGGGSTETAFRHISIYDRPGEGDDVPILSWGFKGALSGDRDAGGYSTRLWVRENIEDVQDGALVVIFTDDWYGITKQSIGGNALGRQNILFIGYIIGESIRTDYQTSEVEFVVSSASELMKNVEAFSVSVQDSLFPIADALINGGDPWYYLRGLTMQSAIYHYIRWHSTINLCTDVEYNATDFNLQFFDADRTSLFDALRTIMESAVFGRVVCDRQNKIWCEIEYEAVDNAATTLPFNMFIDRHDWAGDLEIQEQVVPKVSWIESGGVWWKGKLSNGFAALLSAAPGEVPAYRGTALRIQGLALSSQSQLNIVTGNIYANRNARFPNVGVELVGNYRNFDIAPQERVAITMENESFGRLNWTQKMFAIRKVLYTPDTEKQFSRVGIQVAEIVQGFAADTVLLPAVPPGSQEEGVGDDGDTGFGVPNIEIPPFPDIPPIVFPPLPGYGGSYLNYIPIMGASDTIGIGYTPRPGEPNLYDAGPAVVIAVSGEDTGVAGNFIVPYGYNGKIKIYTLILLKGAAGGNIVLETSHAPWRDWTQLGPPYNAGGTYVVNTIGMYVAKITLQVEEELDVQQGDFISLCCQREGSDLSDTYGSNIAFVGWYIAYG